MPKQKTRRSTTAPTAASTAISVLCPPLLVCCGGGGGEFVDDDVAAAAATWLEADAAALDGDAFKLTACAINAASHSLYVVKLLPVVVVYTLEKLK